MSAAKPTGFKPAYLREALDVLSDNPPTIRWRMRPRPHFNPGKYGDRAFKAWGRTYAGQLIRAGSDGRFRFSLDGKTISGMVVIAEIGVTPIGDRQGMREGMTDDRFAATRDIAGDGTLAAILKDAIDETGLRVDEITVMHANSDPYRMDTPAKHRMAQWFAAQVKRFIPAERRIHVRGVFYACVSAKPPLRKPDGDLFLNNDENEDFLGEAAKYARWLGYVPFERIVDNKNDKPIVIPAPINTEPSVQVKADTLDLYLDADDLAVTADLIDFTPRQPYRLVFFGEKTSLEDVLKPLAERYGADLYLMTGQISDTYLHQIARDGATDGRPLVVFTFSDFDPAGYWDMPTVIGRKLQAMRDLLFPHLDFKVVHAALGPDQVSRLRLPNSPLKRGETRGRVWKQLYGSEQTEIDAVAQLRPDALRDIVHDAVAPYYDETLAARVQTAADEWREEIGAEAEGQIDDERLDRLKAKAAEALERLGEVNAELEAMAEKIEIDGGAPDLPAPDMETLKERQDEQRDAVLIDSDMDYVEATERLNDHSEKAARRT